MRGTADEGGKEPVVFEFINPECKGRRDKAFGKEKEKKDKGTQNLGLVFGRSSDGRVKRQKEFHSLIGIKKAEFLPGFPEFGMEPGSFGRIKGNHEIVEKTLVFMCGLPVFDHSAVPPCNWLDWNTPGDTEHHLLQGRIW